MTTTEPASARSDALVFFGATGDLAYKKIFPALQGMIKHGTNPDWRAEYGDALPDFHDDDITGSCFAIQDYRVHQDFGGDQARARLRQRWAPRGGCTSTYPRGATTSLPFHRPTELVHPGPPDSVVHRDCSTRA